MVITEFPRSDRRYRSGRRRLRRASACALPGTARERAIVDGMMR